MHSSIWECLVIEPILRVGEKLGDSLHDFRGITPEVQFIRAICPRPFPDLVEHFAVKRADVELLQRVGGRHGSAAERRSRASKCSGLRIRSTLPRMGESPTALAWDDPGRREAERGPAKELGQYGRELTGDLVDSQIQHIDGYTSGSSAFKPRARPNTRLFPSGDQFASASLRSPGISCCALPPSAGTS